MFELEMNNHSWDSYISLIIYFVSTGLFILDMVVCAGIIKREERGWWPLLYKLKHEWAAVLVLEGVRSFFLVIIMLYWWNNCHMESNEEEWLVLVELSWYDMIWYDLMTHPRILYFSIKSSLEIQILAAALLREKHFPVHLLLLVLPILWIKDFGNPFNSYKAKYFIYW